MQSFFPFSLISMNVVVLSFYCFYLIQGSAVSIFAKKKRSREDECEKVGTFSPVHESIKLINLI